MNIKSYRHVRTYMPTPWSRTEQKTMFVMVIQYSAIKELDRKNPDWIHSRTLTIIGTFGIYIVRPVSDIDLQYFPIMFFGYTKCALVSEQGRSQQEEHTM